MHYDDETIAKRMVKIRRLLHTLHTELEDLKIAEAVPNSITPGRRGTDVLGDLSEESNNLHD